MSTVDAISLYYHEETPANVTHFLQQQAKPGRQVIVFISPEKVMVEETAVPIAFTDEDVLHFVKAEQARLFPMLNESIYVDFFLENILEDEKLITIVACNESDFCEIERAIHSLHLTWEELRISSEKFEKINLLPWRQKNKKRVRKQYLSVLTMVTGGTIFLMAIISCLCFALSSNDKIHKKYLSHKKHEIVSQIISLEKSSQEVETLVSHLKNKISNAKNQSDLERRLLLIEVLRPEKTILEKIVWRENAMLISGRSRASVNIKSYIDRLKENKIAARLKFMGKSIDQAFPVRFEIEMTG